MQKNILIAIVGIIIIIIAIYFMLSGGAGPSGGGESDIGIPSSITEQFIYATAELNLAKAESLITEDLHNQVKNDIEVLQLSNTQIQIKSFNIISENIEEGEANVTYSVSRTITIAGNPTEESVEQTISLTKINGTWKVSSLPY